MPRWAHLPGVTPEPDRAPLEAAKATLPARFRAPPGPTEPALAYGLALHDAGFFWEAHEVLEAVWLATALNTPERLLIRGFIQLANAGLKRRLGREGAAERLLRESRGEIAEACRRAGDRPGALLRAFRLSHLLEAIEQARRPGSPVPTLAGFRSDA
jgi:hypothetical protein